MNACAILGRSSGIRFENCVVKNFHYGVCFGTSTDNGYDVWVINCQFFNCNSDIDLYGKPSLHISGNVSHGCTGHSIQIEPPYKRDDSIQIINYGMCGILLYAGAKNIQIKGNTISNSLYAKNNDRPWKDSGGKPSF